MNALICLHPGFEELEAVVPIDLLARAGVTVTQAATGDSLQVRGRSGIQLQASCLLSACADPGYDLVILPGGPGIQQLRGDPRLCGLLQSQAAADRWIGCICAAPLLLKDAGLHAGRRITCHPSAAAELETDVSSTVAVDGKLITARGAGSATEFALALVAALQGRDSARTVAESICWSQSD